MICSGVYRFWPLCCPPFRSLQIDRILTLPLDSFQGVTSPPHLSAKARRIWKAAWTEDAFSEAESALLKLGLRELDRAAAAEDLLR